MVNPNTIFIQNVENLCKSPCKTQCKIMVKLSAKLKNLIHQVEIFIFQHTFPAFPTTFPTAISPLYLPKLFHFYTDPTITIIK